MITDRKKGFLRIAVLLLAASLLGGQTMYLSPRAEATPSNASRTENLATGSDAAVLEDPSIDPETGYLEDGDVMFDLTAGSDLATESDALSERKAAGMLAAAPLLRDSDVISTFIVKRWLVDGTYDPLSPNEEVSVDLKDGDSLNWIFKNDRLTQGYVLDKYSVEYKLDDGFESTAWTQTKDVQEGDGLMDDNGQIISLINVITLRIYYKKLTEPVFQGHGMKLTDKIGVRFKIKLPDGFDPSGAYMTFSIKGVRVSRADYSEAEPVEGDSNAKWFTCYINALELNDPMIAAFFYREGSEEKKITAKEYSACMYFEDAKKTYPGNINLRNVVNALQNYGYFLQKAGWTDNKQHKTIVISDNGGFSDQHVNDVKAAVEGMAPVKVMDSSGITDIKYSLTFNTDTRINVFFKPASGVSITTPGGTKETIGGEDYYRFRSKKINVLDLAKGQTISVETSQGTGASLTASALSYVFTVLNGGNADDKEAVTAFYDYYKAAEVYGNGTN